MAHQLSIRIVILGIAALLSSCSAFLLADNCPAPPPCTCSGSSSNFYLRCDSKSLQEIPHFKPSFHHVNSLTLYLYSNTITQIENNAFSNISSFNATNILLRLQDNKLNTIEHNAFEGLENTTQLLIYSNNLTTIPAALVKLTNLEYLDIDNNPLKSLDPSTMSVIGRTLTYLDFDLGSFVTWPKELHYMKLQTLHANYIPFKHLDVNAFHGLENTLTYLELSGSKLEKLPFAVCHLHHLTSLFFNSNQYLVENGSSIFEPCNGKLSSVTSLSLQSNHLHKFPYVFTLFPSLTTLNVVNNQFEYIESQKIPYGSHISSVVLDHNLFERIPSALKKLKSLNSLSIAYNQIKTVESSDLTTLSSLTKLDLQGNPIAYISSSAFSHNLALYNLQLDNTHLDHVPEAVIHLPKLRYLYLSGRPIDCSCDMSYLKHWNASAVTSFSTKCASSTETIKTFVMNSLQSCP